MSQSPDPALAKLGRRVRELRKARKWSQEELAGEANLHRNYVGAVERGELNPTLRSMLRLASALQTNLCGLYPEDRPSEFPG